MVSVIINYTAFTLLSVYLLAISGDITMTWTSPIYPKLKSKDASINPIGRPITDDEDGWIGSLINIGAMIGPLPFSFIADRYGRKLGLLLIAIPHIVSYITMAFAKNVYIFYFARFLGGISVGGGYALLPMYIAEVVDESIRGICSVTLGIFWAIGNFLPYGIGPFMSIMWFNLTLAIIPLAFFVSFLIWGCETPYHLVAENKIAEAEHILMKLRSASAKQVETELNKIKGNLKKEEEGHLLDIFRNAGLRKALLVSLALVTFQQLSGINAIAFYLQPIFKTAGTHISSDVSALIIGAAGLLFSGLFPFIINKFKKKTLLYVSYIGICISLISLGIFFYLFHKNHLIASHIGFLPIVSLITYMFFFQIGASTLPWTISSELFPKNVKQISASATSCACWITSFIVTKYFNGMVALLGNAGVFWFYAGCCAISIIFSGIFVPETKGKSFAEIQDILQK